jgi:predicted nucleotidyltransferase
MKTSEDVFEKFERETPEPKLELIEGRLIIGNSLAGSRYYLHDLLTGWGTEAVLPFAAPQLWRSALHNALSTLTPPIAEAPLDTWSNWAKTVVYEPHLDPAGPRSTGPHFRARERLQSGISHACNVGGFGTSMGHDFVMRLGNNGFTSDGFLVGRQATERLFRRYLRGPADLVWEVLLPGHERQDRDVKRLAFEAGEVPHYWIIDPEKQTIDFLHLINGKYHCDAPDEDGRYRPAFVPGLALVPHRLWHKSFSKDADVFEVEKALPSGWSYAAQDDGIEWDDVPFVPGPSLQPSPLSFDEFVSWCPRAKFEGDGDRTIIDGRLGTRNVIGMLLRTFGLTETVALLHPRDWVAGLSEMEQARRGDSKRKARWWNLARKVANRLRAKRKALRIAVIGSLARPEPLDYWSELSLVVWDLPGGTFENYELIGDLDSERVIDLISAERATKTEQRMIAEEGIEIP